MPSTMAPAVALVLLCALAPAMAQNPSPTPPPVPGVCTTSGGVGVGCGFDMSKLGTFGVDVNPIAPVIQMEWCPEECFTPAHEYDPDCMYCQYSLPDYPNMTYSVPKNVIVTSQTSSGGCFEQQTSAHVEDYEQSVGHAAGGGGWFSSWSKVTEDFYGMYYKTDSSLSLETKNLIWHSLTIPTFNTPKPTFDFNTTVESLPQAYDYKVYKENVIDQFGTHYMANSHIGGSAVMTAYFHSCFLEQFSGHYVYQQSSSSFFGLFGHGSQNSHGYNHTDSKFKQWSNVSMNLVGGFADQYGTLNWTHFLNSNQVQDWEDSVKFSMLPLTYTLEPLYTLISDPVIAANVNRSFVEYGVNIKAYNADVVKKLVPQDPYVKPSWCKFSPHPPKDAAAIKGMAVADSGLPSCPSLPGADDVALALKRREVAKATFKAKQ